MPILHIENDYMTDIADVVAKQMLKELEAKVAEQSATIAELELKQCTCEKPRLAIFAEAA